MFTEYGLGESFDSVSESLFLPFGKVERSVTSDGASEDDLDLSRLRGFDLGTLTLKTTPFEDRGFLEVLGLSLRSVNDFV